MKEYTVLASLSVVLVVLLDGASGVRVLRRPEYYVFFAAMIAMKLLVNGYLTGAQIVRYRPPFYLGVRIGSIPVEDFLFGFSMVTLSIILWEYFKARGERVSRGPR